ncbi:MAG TPA: alpha/beta hydrolase [Dehalococcoidia bacterium]|nr:alpha/beta hydrolase [Dehalococcoidia bacterium]
MEPKDGFVEANGIRLHYMEWGGDAPPVVLLHATGFLARLWEPIAVQMSARFHVYALDARGHGDSDKPVLSGAEGPAPAGGYGWEGLAADLMGFLDAVGLVGVPIVGHSSGAAGAIRLAARRPEYVAAAVLIEPTVFPPMPVEGSDERKEQLASGAAKRRMVWDSREELMTAYRQRRTFAGWREDVLRLFAEHGTFRREDGRIELKCPGGIEAELYRNSLSPDTWDLLPRVRCPTLVIRGERTEPLLALVAEGLVRRIPGARLATIAGASHFVPMERPDAIAAAALAFLEEVVPAA